MNDPHLIDEAAQKAWASLLDHIRQTAPALGATLERCRIIASGSPDWRLLFKDAFSMENAQRRQGPLEEKLSELLGRPVRLSFEVGVKKGSSPIPTAEGPEHVVVAEWMVPVGVVYEVTKSKWNLQRRAVQWYATQGLIPKPEHIGREAYYDKRSIYNYFELIQALSRKWGLSLTEIRRVIAHAEKLEVVQSQDGTMSEPIPALLDFLNDFTEYELRVWELYGREDENTGEVHLTGNSWSRVKEVEELIKKGLRGDSDDLQKLLSKRVLDLEEDLGKRKDGLEEIPF